MKSRWRNVPDYNPSVFRRKTRCMTLREQESFEMPTDLIIEILSRLPSKSIARFRCVSKLWASILRRPDFTELFLTRSSARPHLFFAYRKDGELFFFSTPQPRYLVEDSSPTLLASYQMKIPLDVLNGHFGVSSGWVFLRDWQTLKRKKHLVHVICNPSTGESLTLPSAKTERGRTFLGFDLIEKRYKVLSFYLIDNGRQYDAPCKEHQILTLGTRKPSWRTIKCMVHHHPSLMSGNVICIDGALYYPASTPASYEISMIACFDVRTGKFRFIEYRRGTLVNYKGKLGAIQFEGSNFVSEATTSFKLYILEDVEKGEWSQHTYVLSDSCKNIFGKNDLDFVGVTRTNELVLSPHLPMYNITKPFYIYYYNFEKNTASKVEIQGMDVFKGRRVYTFVDHVENLSPLRPSPTEKPTNHVETHKIS